jgi:protein-S-isoprenylcysteine O-methyltransferase
MMRVRALREAIAKAVQACLICGLILGGLGLVWPAALNLAQLWLVVFVSVLANVFQPPYQPFESSRTPEDKGTGRQILWTMYFTQVLAVTELVYRRRVSLPLNRVTIVTAIMVAFGLILRIWAVVSLGRWFTWNVTVQPGQVLVTDGPYRVIRHPSYVGAWLMFVGSCVLLRSYVAALVASILLLLAFLRRIQHEESLMLATFPEYGLTKKRPARWFPEFDRLALNPGNVMRDSGRAIAERLRAINAFTSKR